MLYMYNTNILFYWYIIALCTIKGTQNIYIN